MDEWISAYNYCKQHFATQSWQKIMSRRRNVSESSPFHKHRTNVTLSTVTLIRAASYPNLSELIEVLVECACCESEQDAFDQLRDVRSSLFGSAPLDELYAK